MTSLRQPNTDSTGRALARGNDLSPVQKGATWRSAAVFGRLFCHGNLMRGPNRYTAIGRALLLLFVVGPSPIYVAAAQGQQAAVVATMGPYMTETPVPKHALLIGVRKYTYLKEVPSALYDVDTFGKKLRDLGFSVVESLDDDYKDAWAKIQAFSRARRPGDLVAVYFSGHGFQYNGLNFLAAKSTPQSMRAADVETDALALEGIFDWLDRRQLVL